MTDLIALPHRALIALTGPDWGKFLNGQTTIDAEKIFDAVANGAHKPLYYGAFLTPQGKLSGDVFICPRDSDTVWIDVDAGLRDELFTKLNLFKLRAKVTLSKPEAQVYAALSEGLPDPRAPGLFRAYGVLEATGNIDTYTDFRLTQGLAEPGLDFPRDYLYPIDINMDLIEAIDFKKGCFVGQETTSRMKRRGTIKNRLIPLTHSGRFDFGAEVLQGERRAGEILASQNGKSLALMRLDRIDGPLNCNGEAATLAVPDWLAPHLAPVET
ncbi:folate-binding protein YgfZ [Asticcacaulis sp. AND118]|uniref:CAF17-like 4Fe-4S cluster assembly/insertion protein YgfZ n=1 Tax=Asticcacaulis sp. AND118 TaxID=2840468 RepID=UPI001CFFC307|nr:folate-binding protein [Asticcacaulis sp. AND118]UDF02659.1 folate-binding protein [Asticcacaulis sp. AND118]